MCAVFGTVAYVMFYSHRFHLLCGSDLCAACSRMMELSPCSFLGLSVIGFQVSSRGAGLCGVDGEPICN